MPLDAEILLRPEAAAGRHVRDVHRVLRQGEQRGELAPVVPDPLALRVDVDAAVLGDDERRLRLEEGVLDELRAEPLRDDVRRAGERRVDVAALHHRARQLPGAVLERRRHGLQHLVADVDQLGGLPRRVPRVGRDRREHVADVGGLLAHGDELAPVARERPLEAVAGNVGRRHDSGDARHGLRGRGVDRDHARPRMLREAERAVQHPRHLDVPDELLVAEREPIAVVARRADADAAAGLELRQRHAALRAGREQDRVDDLHVARAATEVAREQVRDLLPLRLGVLREVALRLQHDSGRAEAALRGAGRDERVRPQLPRLGGEAFLRHDLLALRTASPAGRRRRPRARRRAPCRHRTSPRARSRP